jgi:hypothetical protein
MTLATAVANRDEVMLLPLFAPDVLLDFGGGSGREELRRRLNDPEYRLWDELEALLPLGCAEGADGGITMPWLWAQDLDEDDAFARPDYRLIASPMADGTLKATALVAGD